MSNLLVTRHVAVERFSSFLNRFPHAESRLFSSAETEYCYRFKKGPEERLAARFAAKCAIRSIHSGLLWLDTEILNDPLGAPYVVARNEAVKVKTVTLSHDKKWAIAAVSAVVDDEQER